PIATVADCCRFAACSGPINSLDIRDCRLLHLSGDSFCKRWPRQYGPPLDQGECIVNLLPDWRMVALRGVAALAFGFLTLIWPGLTLWALVVLFGAYALVD